jgi:hypothetical protein
VARRLGANITLNTNDGDPVPEIKRLTEGRGVDVAIEALGRQETFENALRAIRPGGTLSSLGVYSGKLVAPYEAFYAGLGDQKIVTTLCPGGKERMRRLMAMIEARRVDLSSLVTHRFALDEIHVTSTSVGFRLRNAFGEGQFHRRFLLAAGQAYTLMTPAKSLLSVWPSDYALTNVVDMNYVAGVVWGPTPQVRFTYRPSTTFNWAVSIENPISRSVMAL